jgi:hypothetical protein
MRIGEDTGKFKFTCPMFSRNPFLTESVSGEILRTRCRMGNQNLLGATPRQSSLVLKTEGVRNGERRTLFFSSEAEGVRAGSMT